jgi:Flp pilus assembly protein TadD
MSIANDLIKQAAIALQSGQRGSAQRLAMQALAQQPASGEAWNICGVIQIAEARPAQAAGSFGRAETCLPENPVYPRSRAAAQRRAGWRPAARQTLLAAARRGAFFAEPACDLGDLAQEAGEVAAAERAYAVALALKPDFPRAWNNMGEAYAKAGRVGAAAAALRRPALLRDTPADWTRWVQALIAAGQVTTAAAVARTTRRRFPDDAGAAAAVGAALLEDGQADDAAAALRFAATLQPGDGGVWANLGFTDLRRHCGAEAVRRFDRALRIAPQQAETRVGRGCALMLSGKLAEGAADYQQRLRLPQFKPLRRPTAPAWNGEIRPGAALLIHAERGLGDVLQFIRFAPRLRAAGMRVIFHGQAPLSALLQASDVADVVCDYNRPPPPHDFQTDIMSLMHGLKIELSDVEQGVYLRPPPARVEVWRERLATMPGWNTDSRPKIGVVWAGSAQFAYDRQRSPRLAALAPLFAALPGCRFIGLQVGDGRQDLANVAGLPGDFLDLGAEIGDFADTAAIIGELDLVISSCTSTAHLAGALGRPLAVLLDYGAEWRWLQARRDSPWHPTARLYRQPTPGDWAGAVGALRDDLAAALTGRTIPWGASGDFAFFAKNAMAKHECEEALPRP